MSTPDTSPQVSKCHQAPVELSGGVGDFSDSDRVMTMHYVCTECKQPCDLYVADTSPGDELNDVLLDFVLVGLPKDCAMVGGKIIAPERKRQFTEDRNKQYAEAKDRLNRLMLTHTLAELEKAHDAGMGGAKDFEARFWRVIDTINESRDAIDAQLNKEEK